MDKERVSAYLEYTTVPNTGWTYTADMFWENINKTHQRVSWLTSQMPVNIVPRFCAAAMETFDMVVKIA